MVTAKMPAPKKAGKTTFTCRKTRGISPVITTIIISGTLLIILVIASFVSTNILELQVANTEFEQAKTNMLLLDEVIQDVALRRGAGGYVQFNQRSGGIGIYESSEKIKIKVLESFKQMTYVELRPNAPGTFQYWDTFPSSSSSWIATSDTDDLTGVQSPAGSTTAKETEHLQDTNKEGSINSVTAYIRAKIDGETLVYSTITFVGLTTATGNNPQSGSFTLPSGWQTGDVAIFWWYTYRDSKTFTPPSGVTTKYNNAASNFGRLYIGHRVLQSGDSTFNWNASSSGGSTTIWGTSVFRNVDTSNVWDADSGTPKTFSAQNPDPPSVTTVTDKACVITIFGKRDDYTSISPPSGYTLAGQGSSTQGQGASAGVAFKEKSPAGLEDPSAWTLGGDQVGGLIWTGALRPTGTNPEERAVILWRTYDRDYESSSITVSRTTFTSYSEKRTTNPYTGQCWTWDEINALEIGVRASQLGAEEKLKVSELWILVNYTMAAAEELYSSPSLVTLVYRGGSKVSGVEMELRGKDFLYVGMEDPLGYVRIETGNGVQIKLDYNRVRVVNAGTVKAWDKETNFVEMTFIQLQYRSETVGPSGTVYVKVQNANINTITKIHDSGNLSLEVQLGGRESPPITFNSNANQTVVMINVITIQISI
jgi:type II secretory pathway pseudopilin PulG